MPKTIMIIDDEEDIRTYLTAVLEDNGFRTYAPEEEENLIEALQGRQPDLVLLDIMMPRRSGVAIFRDLRTTPGIESIPVALISGIERASGVFNGEIKTMMDDMGLPPPDGFIEKPIKISQLINVIEGILEIKGVAVESSA